MNILSKRSFVSNDVCNGHSHGKTITWPCAFWLFWFPKGKVFGLGKTIKSDFFANIPFSLSSQSKRSFFACQVLVLEQNMIFPCLFLLSNGKVETYLKGGYLQQTKHVISSPISSREICNRTTSNLVLYLSALLVCKEGRAIYIPFYFQFVIYWISLEDLRVLLIHFLVPWVQHLFGEFPRNIRFPCHNSISDCYKHLN